MQPQIKLVLGIKNLRMQKVERAETASTLLKNENYWQPELLWPFINDKRSCRCSYGTDWLDRLDLTIPASPSYYGDRFFQG